MTSVYSHEVEQGRLDAVQEAIDNAWLCRARWLVAIEWLAEQAGLDGVAEQIGKAIVQEVNDQLSIEVASEDEMDEIRHQVVYDLREEAPRSIWEAVYTLAAEWHGIDIHDKRAMNDSIALTRALAVMNRKVGK